MFAPSTSKLNQIPKNEIGATKTILQILVCLLSVAFVFFNVLEGRALVFTENSNATFNGAKVNTVWNNPQSSVQFRANSLTGSYTSVIKNAGANANWNSIAYEPRSPNGKELVANEANEVAYDLNNVNMNNNEGYWRYNEASGTTIADSSGNSRTATCVGTTCPTTTTTSKFNRARDFDGVDDFYTTSNGNSVQGQSIVSFASWIRPENITGERTIYEESSPSINLSRFIVSVINGGVRFRVRADDNTPSDLFLTSGNFVANNWYHVVGVFNATTDVHRFYINGTLLSSVNVALTPFPNIAPAVPPKIGIHSNLPTLIFDGQIDETALFFGRELTTTNVSDMFRRGRSKLQAQVRSCNDPACVGENFVGPGGLTTTFFSDEINTANALPNFALTSAEAPNNQYFQFRYNYSREVNSVQVQLQNVTIDYTIGTGTATLSFAIRNSTDTANTNNCNIGNATTTTLASCSYRLKVSTNSASGYRIFVRTSGGLTSGSVLANSPIGTGGGGGSLINLTTAGTEQYGVFITPGVITGSGGITRTNIFNAGATNSVNFSDTSNQQMLTALGTNSPLATDTTNTSLITHNLNISPGTPAGVYTQSVIYTAVANF